jgi:hypothetical protein
VSVSFTLLSVGCSIVDNIRLLSSVYFSTGGGNACL